jgi:3-hydroxybutyryl-CoA dehydratase
VTVYLEDISVGDQYLSESREISAKDIDAFATLSGDFNPLHTDDKWVAENTPYKGRIAHGLLVLAVSSALTTECLDDWVVIAYLETNRRMLAPIYPGQAIRHETRVTEVRRTRSRPDAGIVVVEVRVLSDSGDVVQEGSDSYLVGARLNGDSGVQ